MKLNPNLLKATAVGALGGLLFGFDTAVNTALEAIAPTDFSMWRPEECPLCRARVPLETVSDVE